MSMSKDEGVTTAQVAVRQQDADKDWLVVGAVRSASGVSVEAAVARQRSLIADVSDLQLQWIQEEQTRRKTDSGKLFVIV